MKKDMNILDIFYIEDTKESNICKLKRLCCIMSRYRNRKCYSNCSERYGKCKDRNILKIRKCRYKKDKLIPLRIFLKEIDNCFYICLIDLYHMGWPATNKKIGKEDLQGLYIWS
ncbi:hypothetical protein [Candidatus Endomicrobiellum trichonymphae]|uniref:hypothetical protein n=1 Tax=Endomicrobium trichonymphae TaxID=1408204 RepID=UPI0039B8A7AC